MNRIVQILAPFLLALMFTSSAAAAQKLIICHAGIAGALIPLAQMQGYFDAEGLQVETRLTPSGFQALQAMLEGDCPFAFAATPPIGYQSLRRHDFRILATLSTSSDFDRLIVRRDRGIQQAADLPGRKIAVPEGTSAHYFLDTYLAANGISPGEVNKRFLPAQEIPGAFKRGEVDAAALWEPRIMKMAEALGTQAAVLTLPGLVVSPFVLLAREDTLQTRPEAAPAVLRALIKAENFARAQPVKAKAMLTPYFGVSANEVENIWAMLDYRVALEQPLLFILESVTRWHIRQMPPATRPALPNYLNFLYPQALKSVKPGAVSLID